MTSLRNIKCVACNADSPHVTDQELALFRPQVPDWELIEDGSIRKLRRVFRFPDFLQALAFTNAVGELAEAEDHHPRLVTEWGRVSVTWWTHAIRDLHRNDFIMAALTDDAARRLPAQGAGAPR